MCTFELAPRAWQSFSKTGKLALTWDPSQLPSLERMKAIQDSLDGGEAKDISKNTKHKKLAILKLSELINV